MKRVFEVIATIYASIEIDDVVFAQVTDEWQKRFYKLRTRQEIAEHLAFNLLQDRSFTSLDGFADLPKDAARVPPESVHWEVEAILEKS